MASTDAQSLLPVFVDFEVTDGTRNGEIFQIGAYCSLGSSNIYSRFILPIGNIDWYVSKKVTKVSIVRGDRGWRYLFDLDTKVPIPSLSSKDGFEEFINWMIMIKDNLGFEKIMLIAFGNLELDKECLILNLQSCDVLEKFNSVVSGIYNGAQFVNMNFKNLSGQGLDKLYKNLFPQDPMFKHHNAAEDAKALGEVMEELRKQKCLDVGGFVANILHWSRDEIEELLTLAVIAAIADEPKTPLQIKNDLIETSIFQLLKPECIDLMELIGRKEDLFCSDGNKISLRKYSELVQFLLDSKRISTSSSLFFDDPQQIQFGQDNNDKICPKIGQVSVSGKLLEKDCRIYIDNIGGIVVKREIVKEQATSPSPQKPNAQGNTLEFDYVSKVNNLGKMPVYAFSKASYTPNAYGGVQIFDCFVTLPIVLTANGSHKDKNVETAKRKSKQAAAKSMLRRMERDQVGCESTEYESFSQDMVSSLALRCSQSNLAEPCYELSKVDKSVLPYFTCKVSLTYTASTGGSGENKKSAKQAAAKAILDILGNDKKKKNAPTSNEKVKEQVVLCSNLGDSSVYLNYYPKPKPPKESDKEREGKVTEVARKDSGIGKEEEEERNQGKLYPGMEVTFSLRVEFRKETSRIKVTNVTKKQIKK